jgi:predicted DNA-binding transcriptional regulator YafY
MADVPQVERQLFILSLLSDNKRGFTLDELMSSLKREGIDISRKTLERDLDYITDVFYVYEDDRDGKTIYLSNKYSLKNISFSVADMIALQFGREVMRSYNGLEVGSNAEKLLDKLISQGPSINRQYIETLTGMMKVSIADITPDRPDPDFLNLLRDSITDRKQVRISYYAFNTDEITDRLFDPYLLEVYDGCWHVVGFCHLRGHIRDFRVSRIKSLELTAMAFHKPENFYDEYKHSRFDKLTGETAIRLKVRFSGQAARYVREYESGKATRLTEDGNGNLIFEKDTSLSPEIVRWVLNYGSGAEVLEPVELREMLKAEIAFMGTMYP